MSKFPSHLDVSINRNIFKHVVAKDAPQPRLHDMGLSHIGPYLMLMIDPDWNKTSPPSVIVHTVVANLTTNVNSTSDANIIAKYIGPAPRSGTHNYTTFLFDQPSNFSIPTRYQSFMEINDQTPLNRLNLPLESFISQTGLGTPVAANYFRVTAASNSTDNSTGTSTTSTTTSTSASSTSSGAAVGMSVGQNYYVASALALVGAVLVAV